MRTLATKSTLVLAATFGAVFAGTFARADADDVGKWYLNPMIQAVWVDDDRNADDNWGAQLGIGKALSEDWNVELNYAHSIHDGALGNDLRMQNVELDALRVFYRDSARTNPYLLGGIGWLYKNYETTDNSSAFAGSLGAGLLVHLAESADGSFTTNLRGEIKVRYELNSGGNTSVDYLAGLGLQFAWGRPRPAAPAEPVVVPPPPADTDGDGVIDPQDRCPGTPPNSKVDAVGCELDSDGDGVLDSADQCPGTLAGRRVDPRGCEIKKEIELRGVKFATDKADLLPESYPMLEDAIATLKKYPDLKIEVAGHTDDRGTAAHNQSLSQRRAETVEKYLKDGGVTNELKAVGYGESQPLEDNATDAGRQANRRVVLKIISN